MIMIVINAYNLLLYVIWFISNSKLKIHFIKAFCIITIFVSVLINVKWQVVVKAIFAK